MSDMTLNSGTKVTTYLPYILLFVALLIALGFDGWTVQPVFQYVFHPGGGVVDPNDPTQANRIKDAAVFGLRSTFNY